MEGRDVDLIEFLRARLDEDEEVALRPSLDGLPCDHWDAAGADGLDRVSLSHWSIVRVARMEVAPAARASAEHIARWDPARVLAEVQVKRAILAAWREQVEGDDPHAYLAGDILPRLLAQPYADHPDFDPAWLATPA